MKAAQILSEKGGDEKSIEAVLEDSISKSYEKKKPTAFAEFRISSLMKQLKQVREDTKARVERKQALTDKERVFSS